MTTEWRKLGSHKKCFKSWLDNSWHLYTNYEIMRRHVFAKLRVCCVPYHSILPVNWAICGWPNHRFRLRTEEFNFTLNSISTEDCRLVTQQVSIQLWGWGSGRIGKMGLDLAGLEKDFLTCLTKQSNKISGYNKCRKFFNQLLHHQRLNPCNHGIHQNSLKIRSFLTENTLHLHY
jgi:hypothetical protein